MSKHVVVGAGPVGTAVAVLLAQRGDHVRLVTRRGTGPQQPGIELVAADATDSGQLTELATGVAALYNCASPPYHQWLTGWPPLHAAFLAAAERTGAVLATMSNLYGYGAPGGPITPQAPIAATHPKLLLRARMWDDQLARHQAGRIRAVEVRASDYIEANSLLSLGIGKAVLAGKRGYVPAPLDVPHSWTSVHDCAKTLARVAADERAHGQVWFAPANPALTIRQLAARFAEANKAPAPKLTPIPYPVLWTSGLFSPMIRELRTTRYQFTQPFIIDSSATTRELGLPPGPLDEALRDTAARLRR
ncbi:MAG: NAD-dependent epimerase [Streptosporangiaceae bacterium]|jgi:nucleoside-diphosphate-sugar epimerase